jgi:pyruvate/2-oxoglutarate dehydrogenase complex dihydrolipoamide dehydrogenase (E3) component
MTHIEALELDRVPEHLVVLGGGYVGPDLAQAFRRFRSRVTIIERNATLIHREYADITAAMAELLLDEEIQISTDMEVKRVLGRSGEGVRLEWHRAGADLVIERTDLLVAAGHTPSTDGIGLDTAGAELDARVYVQVNERL